MATMLSNIRALKSYSIERSTFDNPNKKGKSKPFTSPI